MGNMKAFSGHPYEQAFEHWLINNRVDYVRADEHRRIGTRRRSVKNFDFLVYPSTDRRVIVEIKGRTFKGTTMTNMTGLECWVTADDVAGLGAWQEALGPDHEAVFVFAYRVAQVDVDFDGRDVLEYAGEQYVFFCVHLDDYHRHMKCRSPKWQTVTLSARAFRQCAISLGALLLPSDV